MSLGLRHRKKCMLGHMIQSNLTLIPFTNGMEYNVKLKYVGVNAYGVHVYTDPLSRYLIRTARVINPCTSRSMGEIPRRLLHGRGWHLLCGDNGSGEYGQAGEPYSSATTSSARTSFKARKARYVKNTSFSTSWF